MAKYYNNIGMFCAKFDSIEGFFYYFNSEEGVLRNCDSTNGFIAIYL